MPFATNLQVMNYIPSGHTQEGILSFCKNSSVIQPHKTPEMHAERGRRLDSNHTLVKNQTLRKTDFKVNQRMTAILHPNSPFSVLFLDDLCKFQIYEPVATIDYNKYQDESQVIEGFWMDIEYNVTVEYKETKDSEGNDAIADIKQRAIRVKTFISDNS